MIGEATFNEEAYSGDESEEDGSCDKGGGETRGGVGGG